MVVNKFIIKIMKLKLSVKMERKFNKTYWNNEFPKPLNSYFLILKTII
jgi:hypothetical protein